MGGKKRKNKRTRSRSGKQARQRERDGPNTSVVSVAQEERPEVVVKIRLDLPEELQGREERSTMVVSPPFQATNLVGVIPTLPPVKMEPDDSNPWQSLKASVGGIINKVRGFLAGGLSHPEDLEKRVIARLDRILEVRAQALKEEDLEKSKRFGAASARLGEYLRRLQTTDAN